MMKLGLMAVSCFLLHLLSSQVWAAADVIRIGFVPAFNDASSQDFARVLKTAVDDLNQIRGDENRDVELVVIPIHTKTADESGAFIAAALKYRVDVVIGGTTEDSAGALRTVAAQTKTPTLILHSSPVGTRAWGAAGNIAYMEQRDEVVFQTAIKYWVRNLKAKRVAVIFDKTDPVFYQYGSILVQKSLANIVDNVIEFPFKSLEIDQLDSLVTSALSERLDAIIICANPWDTANLSKVIGKKSDLTVFGATPGGWSPQMSMFVAGGAADFYYGAQSYPLAMASIDNAKFSNNLREKLNWHADSEIGHKMVQAYDAVNLAVQLHESLDGNENKIMAYWNNVKEFNGLSGAMTVSADGSIVASTSILKATKMGAIVASHFRPRLNGE